MGDDEPYPQQMMIDAGPQGTGHSGHGHADALSIRFSVEGQRVLIDPGTCVYISDDHDRNLFRGTSAHNTLRVNGVDQALPVGPFAWSATPTVQTEHWISGKGFDFFVGSHNGYGRIADPVLHRRLIFRAKGGFWFLLDRAQGQQAHLLEVFWHFAPSLRVAVEDGDITAKFPESPEQTINAAGIALLACRNSAWNAELSSALDSPAYGTKRTTPMACLSSRTLLPAQSALLLVPLMAGTTPGYFADCTEAGSNARAYRYDLPQSTHYVILHDGGGNWTHSRWTSDAELLYCHLRDGRPAHLVMISGSFANWQEQNLVSLQKPAEFVEWREGSVSASEDARVQYFAEVDDQFLRPVP
jgi:hypothetical protein